MLSSADDEDAEESIVTTTSETTRSERSTEGSVEQHGNVTPQASEKRPKSTRTIVDKWSHDKYNENDQVQYTYIIRFILKRMKNECLNVFLDS